MKKTVDFLKKFSIPALTLLFAGLAAFCLFRVGYFTLPQASGNSRRQIINDDYSEKTAPVTQAGFAQEIALKKGERIYGVNLLFHTYGKIQSGRLYLELLDAQGEKLTGAETPMENLLNDTFHGFLFDEPVQRQENESLILRIYCEPRTENDRVALWQSRKAYDGFGLYTLDSGSVSLDKLKEKQPGGTIALQYITEHVGNRIYDFYYIFAGIALVGMSVAFLLALKMKKRPEIIFLAFALTLGCLFSIFTPMSGGPDEYVHIATAYKMSSGMLGQNSIPGEFAMRRRDVADYADGPVSYDAFRFKKMRSGLFKKSEDDFLYSVHYRVAQVYSLPYLPRALGVTAARLMGFNYATVVFLGRMANLLFYCAVVFMAIKLSPIGKNILAAAALLPMNLQLAGSFSYDSFVNSMIMLFIALTLRLISKGSEKKLSYMDMIPAAAVLCLLSPAKTIYVLCALFVLAVPARLFKDKKTAAACKVCAMAAAVIFWGFANFSDVVATLRPHDFTPFTPKARQSSEVVAGTEDDSRAAEENLGTGETPAAKEGRESAAENPAQEAEKPTVYPSEALRRENRRTIEQIAASSQSDILPNGDSRFLFNLSYILRHPAQTAKLLVNSFIRENEKYLTSMLGTRLGELIVVDLTASGLFTAALAAILMLSVATSAKEKSGADLSLAPRLTGAVIFLGVCAGAVAACVMWTPINYTVIFGVQGRYFLPVLPFAMLAAVGRIKTEKDPGPRLMTAESAVSLLVLLNVFMKMCAVL